MRNRFAPLGLLAVNSLALILAGLPALGSGAIAHHPPSGIRPKDGTYRGTLSLGLKKIVYLTVSRNGTKADARLICDGQPYGHSHMGITKGAFRGKHQLSPGVQVWTLQGHFTSKTTAIAHLGAGGVCDGKSGNVKLAIS